jgi:hypothetical protein
MILTGFCKVKKDFRGSETRTGLTNLPIPERFHATAPRGHRPPAWKGSVLEIHTANVRRGHPLARHDAVRRPGPRPGGRASALPAFSWPAQAGGHNSESRWLRSVEESRRLRSGWMRAGCGQWRRAGCGQWRRAGCGQWRRAGCGQWRRAGGYGQGG